MASTFLTSHPSMLPATLSGCAKPYQCTSVHGSCLSCTGRSHPDLPCPGSSERCNDLLCLQLLGRAIKHLPRDQIIVATKVGKYIAGEPADFSAARVTKSVHESLERMQLKHIDLIQVHDIEFAEDMRQVCTCIPK